MTRSAPRVVITGASSGIGRALAFEFARRGATLALFARRRDALAALAANLPVRTHCYAVDVRDAEAVGEAGRDFLGREGCPDIVVANAGVSVGTLTAEAQDNEAFAEVMATNVNGMMHTYQPFIASMIERGDGVLAGIASVAGFRGLPGSSAYSASKAAAITYLESLRVELRDSGIAVVTICPGYIATPMTAVNRYPMPFLMEADTAARKIAAAIEGRTRFKVIPWQMALVGAVLRRLPRPLYDRIFARAPRKGRRNG